MRWLSVVLGAVFALAGAWFVAERIAAGWSDYGKVVINARWAWSLGGLALALIGMTSMGMVWRLVIRALGWRAERRQVFVWYQLGNLGKYLPGGIWPLVGRAELAVRDGVPRSVAYNSVAVSIAATYLCGALVSAVLLPFALTAQAALSAPLWVFAVIPLGLVMFHPAVLAHAFRLSESVLGKGAQIVVPTWRTSAALVIRHAPPWIANGLATWLVALTFAPDAPLLPLVLAGILSWVVGFLVVFVPGGIGVREAVLTAVASVALPPDIAATVAIVSRLVFTIADALGAIAAVVVRRMRASFASSDQRLSV